jgi:hypothetical protein
MGLISEKSSSSPGRGKNLLSAPQRQNRLQGHPAMYEIGNGVLNGIFEKDEKRMYKKMPTNRIQKARRPDLNVRHIS